MSTELQHEYEKFGDDTVKLVEMIPNPIVKMLVRACVRRLLTILSLLIKEKEKNG